MGSVLTEFDEVLLKIQSTYDSSIESKFLKFVECNVEQSQSISALKGEIVRLQDELMKSEREVSSMQMKLKNARQLLDVEKNRTAQISKEKFELEKQVSRVLEMLGPGQVDETKEVLQMLSNTLSSDSRRSDFNNIMSPIRPLSTISENDDMSCMDSILSVSDIDLTNGEELEISSKTRSGRAFRSSTDGRLNKSGQKGKSADTRGNPAKKLSRESKDDLGEKDAEFTIARTLSEPSAPPVGAVDEFFDAIGNTPKAPVTPYNHCKTPMQSGVSRQTLPATPMLGRDGFPMSPLVRSSTSRINLRPHCFSVKVIYWTDFCQQCEKRIKFGRNAYKCRECKATCHMDCKDLLPLPCVPTAHTPASKNTMELISDFTPMVPPMIPGLMVHCTNEIEKKGLSEVGLYRISGSEKDVKELKDKFMKGRCMPNLSLVDVHVICGALKLFLRSLKEPLVTFGLWQTFLDAAQKEDPQDRNAALYQAISDLPQPNRDTMAWLILHLHRVAESEECKMPLYNLSKVFGPTIIGYSVAQPVPATILNETHLQQVVMQRLLEICPDYWESCLATCEDNGVSSDQDTPVQSRRRKSTLTKTPLRSRDIHTPRL